MVNYFKPFVIPLLALFLVACQENENPELNQAPEGIVGTWRYLYVRVADSLTTSLCTSTMEPGLIKASLGGERAEINRREIRYFEDGTYQLTWLDRGSYALGTEGDPNWQPSFGSYQLSEAKDSLFHNSALAQETPYSLSIEGNILSRRSRRFMSVNSSEHNGFEYQQLWRRGDYVEYVEVFERIWP